MNGRAVRVVPYLLAFFSSLCIMVLELVASRLVARHVGASLPVWTTVIGIMLGGICLGNVLGGRLADRIEPSRAIAPLYAPGSALTLGCLWMNTVVGFLPGLNSLPLGVGTILVVSLDFLIPGTVLGMISPVMAKMAVEQAKRAGGAIGDIYFLGAVGSIAGTFLAGYWLIYAAPTSTIVNLVAAGLLIVGLVLVDEEGLTGRGVALVLLSVGLGLAVLALGSGLLDLILNRGTTEASRNPTLATAMTWLFAMALGSWGVALLVSVVMVALKRGGLGLAAFAAALLLAIGSLESILGLQNWPGIVVAEIKVNFATLAGQLLTFGIAASLVGRLKSVPAAELPPSEAEMQSGPFARVRLGDLAALSFVASLTFMSLEMVAGRLVTRHLGSSIYGWTSVICVLLGGLSVGNWLGGRIANHVREEKHASWLFLVASVLTAMILLAEYPPHWVVKGIRNPIESLMIGREVKFREDDRDSFLMEASTMAGFPWGFRVLFWVATVFLLPSLAMGTVGPVVAKLAVDRVRARTKGTGQAIGQVYAWGMVGSILGTFLAGFFLIDVFGTKGLILILATTLAISATVLGSIWHAAWAGIPLGLCVIAFAPALLPASWTFKPAQNARKFLLSQGQSWGLREEAGEPNDPRAEKAYIDESNYYYIKIENQLRDDGNRKRTLVLDNLIHGYYIENHPEELDYDYEHIYALVTRRVVEARMKTLKLAKSEDVPLRTMFLGGGSYTYPRYLQEVYPKTAADVAEIDPAVTKANHAALFLPANTTIKTTWGDARQYVTHYKGEKYDLIFGDAFNDFSVPWHLTTKEFNDRIAAMLSEDGVYMINIIDIYKSDYRSIFSFLYHAEVAAVEKALKAAGAADSDKLAEKVVLAMDDKKRGIDTSKVARKAADAALPWPKEPPKGKAGEAAKKAEKPGEAAAKGTPNQPALIRAAVVKALAEAKIPERGTVEEMAETSLQALSKIDSLKKLPPDRLAAWARVAAEADLAFASDYDRLAQVAADGVADARAVGAFLGSWVETAKKSFAHTYVFGTASEPGEGERETFVVVASKKPLDLNDLGRRIDDPHFFRRSRGGEPGDQVTPEVYPEVDMKSLAIRSRGIILSDDYAPVENLLAPVARTRERD